MSVGQVQGSSSRAGGPAPRQRRTHLTRMMRFALAAGQCRGGCRSPTFSQWAMRAAPKAAPAAAPVTAAVVTRAVVVCWPACAGPDCAVPITAQSTAGACTQVLLLAHTRRQRVHCRGNNMQGCGFVCVVVGQVKCAPSARSTYSMTHCFLASTASRSTWHRSAYVMPPTMDRKSMGSSSHGCVTARLM